MLKCRVWLFILLAVALAISLSIYLSRTNHSPRTVVYSASGSFALADLCITTPSGEKCQAVSGFSQVSASAQAGEFVAMSVRIVDGTGPIRCTITIAGLVRDSETNPAIAFCQAIAP